jgi:hypothetical protein
MLVTSAHQQAVGAASAPVCRVNTESRQLRTGQAILLRLTNKRHDCTPQHLKGTAAAAWAAVSPVLLPIVKCACKAASSVLSPVDRCPYLTLSLDDKDAKEGRGKVVVGQAVQHEPQVQGQRLVQPLDAGQVLGARRPDALEKVACAAPKRYMTIDAGMYS